MSKYGVISGPNTGKYGPEITPYLDTFHAVPTVSNENILATKQEFFFIKVTLLQSMTDIVLLGF